MGAGLRAHSRVHIAPDGDPACRYERRVAAGGSMFDYFGQSGGGAPVRNAQGEVVADLSGALPRASPQSARPTRSNRAKQTAAGQHQRALTADSKDGPGAEANPPAAEISPRPIERGDKDEGVGIAGLRHENVALRARLEACMLQLTSLQIEVDTLRSENALLRRQQRSEVVQL